MADGRHSDHQYSSNNQAESAETQPLSIEIQHGLHDPLPAHAKPSPSSKAAGYDRQGAHGSPYQQPAGLLISPSQAAALSRSAAGVASRISPMLVSQAPGFPVFQSHGLVNILPPGAGGLEALAQLQGSGGGGPPPPGLPPGSVGAAGPLLLAQNMLSSLPLGETYLHNDKADSEMLSQMLLKHKAQAEAVEARNQQQQHLQHQQQQQHQIQTGMRLITRPVSREASRSPSPAANQRMMQGSPVGSNRSAPSPGSRLSTPSPSHTWRFAAPAPGKPQAFARTASPGKPGGTYISGKPASYASASKQYTSPGSSGGKPAATYIRTSVSPGKPGGFLMPQGKPLAFVAQTSSGKPAGYIARASPGKPESFARASPGKPEAFARASPGKPEAYARASPGKPESFARASPGKPEAYARASPGKPEAYARASPGKPESFARASPGKPEAFARASTGKPEAFARASPGKPETFIRVSPGKPEAYTRTSSGKPEAFAKAKEPSGKPDIRESGKPDNYQKLRETLEKSNDLINTRVRESSGKPEATGFQSRQLPGKPEAFLSRNTGSSGKPAVSANKGVNQKDPKFFVHNSPSQAEQVPNTAGSGAQTGNSQQDVGNPVIYPGQRNTAAPHVAPMLYNALASAGPGHRSHTSVNHTRVRHPLQASKPPVNGLDPVTSLGARVPDDPAGVAGSSSGVMVTDIKEEKPSVDGGNSSEEERQENPFNMRVVNLSNFPTSQTQRAGYRSHAVAMLRAKAGSIINPAKSLDIVRQNLQKFINLELDKIIQNYIETYFRPALENIRQNQGEGAVGDDSINNVAAQILEEAKKMYQTSCGESRSVTPDLSDNLSDAGSARSSHLVENKDIRATKHSLFNIRKRRGSSDSDASGISKKRGRKPKVHHSAHHVSGRVTPVKHSSKGDPVKREGSKWDPERLTVDTEFVMGARANKALGLGAMRGRLYVKHPDLFKYCGDQDDKTWLHEQRHMPATGGKAYLLIVQDIRDLAETDEYKAMSGVSVNTMVTFTVPQWMIDKMKVQMQALRTDLPKGGAAGKHRIPSPMTEQDGEGIATSDDKLPFTAFFCDGDKNEDSKDTPQLSPNPSLGNTNEDSVDLTPAASPFNLTGGFTTGAGTEGATPDASDSEDNVPHSAPFDTIT